MPQGGKVTSLYREVRDAILQEKVGITQALRPVTTNPADLLKLEGKGQVMVSEAQAVRKGTFE